MKEVISSYISASQICTHPVHVYCILLSIPLSSIAAVTYFFIYFMPRFALLHVTGHTGHI